MIETDCHELVELLEVGWEEDHPDGGLLEEIKSWLENEWVASVEWSHRTTNTVSDLLAKEALEAAEGAMFFDDVPYFISSAVVADLGV